MSKQDARDKEQYVKALAEPDILPIRAPPDPPNNMPIDTPKKMRPVARPKAVCDPPARAPPVAGCNDFRIGFARLEHIQDDAMTGSSDRARS